jgi:hypothetical protein
VKTNDSRARVRWDGAAVDVQFEEADGGTRRFTAHRVREVDVTNQLRVEVLSSPNSQTTKETAMSTKTTKTSASTKAPKGSAPKAAKEKATKAMKTKATKSDGKMSCLDAAANVLASAGKPMNTKDMIEAMAAKGLWTSPAGKTPAATLYSAILREINTKKAEARFKKQDRGLFASTGK